MRALPESTQAAVIRIRQLAPVLKALQAASADGFFPHFTAGLDDLEGLAPRLEALLGGVSGAAGGLFERAAGDLNSKDWEPFLNFLQAELPQATVTAGETVGHLTKGLAQLWMQLSPLSHDFTGGLLAASERFDRFTAGLKDSQKFEEFLDYVHQTGPEVVHTVGAIADAVLQIGEAAAPLGGPVLDALELLANVLGTIADSPAGPVIMAAATATSALSLATKGLQKVAAIPALATFSTDVDRANKSMTVARPAMRDFGRVLVFGGQSAEQLSKQMQSSSVSIAAQAREVAKSKLHVNSWISSNKRMIAGTAALAAGAVAAETGLLKTTTAQYALMGAMAAGPWGALAGATIGTVQSFGDAADKADQALEKLRKSAQNASSFEVVAQGAASAASDLEAAAHSYSNTDALLGSIGIGTGPGEMIDKLKSGLTDARKELSELTIAGNALVDATGQGRTNFELLDPKDVNQINSALAGWAPSIQAVAPAMQALGISVDDLMQATKDPQALKAMIADLQAWQTNADSAAGRADNLSTALGQMDNTLIPLEQRAKMFGTALDQMVSPRFNRAAAINDWHQALNGFGAALSDKTHRLTGFSEGALKNQDAIQGAANQLLGMVKAQAEAGAGSIRMGKTLTGGIEQIVRTGKAAGLNEKEIRQYLRTLGLTPRLKATIFKQIGIDEAEVKIRHLIKQYRAIPKNVKNEVNTYIKQHGVPKSKAEIEDMKRSVKGLTSKQINTILGVKTGEAKAGVNNVKAWLRKLEEKKTTPKVDVDTATATKKVHTLQGDINAMTGKTVTVTILEQRKSSSAQGNYFPRVRYFAEGGDIPNGHQPEMAGPGTVRVWREPETQGESYIPHANDYRRPRARQVLEQTASVLGGQVEWFRNGGIRVDPGRYQSRAEVRTVRVVGTLDTPLGPAYFNELAREVSRDEVDDYDSWTKRQGRNH